MCPVPACGDAPSPAAVTRRGDSAVLVAAALLAAAAALARRPDGSALLPAWCDAALQLPALLLWIGMRWRPAARRTAPSLPDSEPRASTHGADRWPTLLVLAGGGGLALARHDASPFFISATVFICAMLLLEGLARRYAEIERRIAAPFALLRCLLGPWGLLIVAATVLLSVPAATHPAVPDYRHNFWNHVLDNAFAATSSACLVGNTIYGFAEEYTPFGQGVLVLTTQLAGISFCALALAIVSPFLCGKVRLRTVLFVAFGLQALAAGAMWAAGRSDGAGGLWMSVVHAASALWNSGLVAGEVGGGSLYSDRVSFTCMTSLAIAGSIGLPLMLDLLRRPGRGDATPHKPAPTPIESIPCRRLAQFEAAGALGLLFFGAFFLFYFETPGALPPKLVPTRPFDLGENRVALREEPGHAARWKRAVFVSAALRSAGLECMPIAEGSLSWPSCALVLAWVFIGGSAGGLAGGMCTTAILLPAMCVLYDRHAWRREEGGPAVRRLILVRVPLFVAAWAVVHVLAALLLVALSGGTVYEVVFESAMAVGGVGLSTDLALHLTPLGRMAMIVLFITGRWLPVMFWLHLAGRVARSLGRHT